jgi:hypothetical protein
LEIWDFGEGEVGEPDQEEHDDGSDDEGGLDAMVQNLKLA